MEALMNNTKVLYTAKTHTTGGREHGIAKSSDGHLEIHLSSPGTTGTSTNPEQLFAAGWSACFEGAIGIAAARKRIVLPEDPTIDAEVDLCLEKAEFFLQARLNISLPGLDRVIARELIEAAEKICPYAKAIAGNVHVEYNLI